MKWNDRSRDRTLANMTCLSRASSAALIAALPAYPVLTVDSAARVLGRSIQAANEALAKLEKAGIVKVTRAAKWRRTFEAPELLDLVAAFEKDLALPDEAATPA